MVQAALSFAELKQKAEKVFKRVTGRKNSAVRSFEAETKDSIRLAIRLFKSALAVQKITRS